MTCLQCRLTLVNPDKNHRYCPYCGAIRAIGADNDLLFCGEESLSNYRAYAYSSVNAYPVELDPVSGPKDASPWPRQDLVASSASPYPWSSLRMLGPSGEGTEHNLETPLKLARMRHRRLFLLTENGQQFSLHSQTLKQLAVREVSPHQDLFVSESLLHLTSPNRDATNWTAYPLSRIQDSVLEQRLPIYQGALTVSFDAFAALGAEQGGQQEFLWGRLGEPGRHHKARLGLSSAGERGRPGLVRCGDDWLIVALDGKLYRQSAVDPDPTEPENIFANPNRLKVLQMLTQGPGERVVLLAQSTSLPRQTVLITVGPDSEPAFRKLAVGNQEGELRLTSLPDGLFLAIKPVGEAIAVYRLGPDSEDLLMRLPGSLQHELDGLYPLPGDYAWGLMLATKREQHWELWKIELPTGSYKQLQGQEPSHHRLSFPWESGRGLYVNLTTGRIRELV